MLEYGEKGLCGAVLCGDESAYAAACTCMRVHDGVTDEAMHVLWGRVLALTCLDLMGCMRWRE